MQNAKQESFVQNIRNQYMEPEHTDLDTCKALDRNVKKPATIFAILFGTSSALIMGSGMSLIMTDIGSIIGITEPMFPGLLIGTAGMLMAALTYPIYRGILRTRRKRYADKMLAQIEKILES